MELARHRLKTAGHTYCKKVVLRQEFFKLHLPGSISLLLYKLSTYYLLHVGVEVRNTKMDLNIYGTWCRVMFEKLMMKI